MALWRVGAALMLAATALFMNAAPAAALDLNPQNYFQLTYDPVTFDKVEIAPGGSFNAIIRGRATCSKSLPISVSQAVITSQVIARHNASGASLTLNASYVITIEPFPGKKGQTFEISQTIPLQLLARAEPGEYTVIGQLTEAKAKIFFFWRDFTGSLPAEQAMGTIKCVIPQPAPEPPETAPQAPPATATPAPAPPTPITTAEPVPELEQYNMSWWNKLLIIAAGAAGFTVIFLFLYHRRKKP